MISKIQGRYEVKFLLSINRIFFKKKAQITNFSLRQIEKLRYFTISDEP